MRRYENDMRSLILDFVICSKFSDYQDYTSNIIKAEHYCNLGKISLLGVNFRGRHGPCASRARNWASNVFSLGLAVWPHSQFFCLRCCGPVSPIFFQVYAQDQLIYTYIGPIYHHHYQSLWVQSSRKSFFDVVTIHLIHCRPITNMPCPYMYILWYNLQ